MSFHPYEEGSSDPSKDCYTIKTPEGAINEFRKNPEGFHYIVCLEGKARKIFDKIPQAEKATLEGAINKIKENLDTTQNRELIFKALSICKQNEGESVEQFASRLIPMIEATSRDHRGNVSEEALCRTFLEKLSPDLQFLTRTLTGPNRKNFDTLLLNAQEAELMLCANTKATFSPLCQITDQGTSLNILKYEELNEDLKTKAPWVSHNNSTHNNGRWDNQPICSYCDKVGHFEFNCRKRQNQEENQSLEEVADEQRIVKQMLKEQGEILNVLVSKINELTTNH
uniref:CCHC-type domain-containing protein n=1 Tax=Meloidogyne javanica TaxID=6303 RepID=A0A915MM00_MELJA